MIENLIYFLYMSLGRRCRRAGMTSSSKQRMTDQTRYLAPALGIVITGNVANLELADISFRPQHQIPQFLRPF